jgi:hypothetical protein
VIGDGQLLADTTVAADGRGSLENGFLALTEAARDRERTSR